MHREGSLYTIRRGSSSLDVSETVFREEMEHDLIIMDRLYIFKDLIPKRAMTGARTFAAMEAGVSHTFLAGGQTYLTPL